MMDRSYSANNSCRPNDQTYILNSLLAYAVSALQNTAIGNLKHAIIANFSDAEIEDAKYALWDYSDQRIIGEMQMDDQDSNAIVDDIINALIKLQNAGATPTIGVLADDLNYLPKDFPEEQVINEVIAERLMQLEYQYTCLQTSVDGSIFENLQQREKSEEKSNNTKAFGRMMEEEDEEVLFDQADFDGDGDRTALLSSNKSHVQTLPESHSYKPKGPSRCYKVFSTICLCAAFLGLGLCIGIPGPTLLDLQQQTNTDTETISRIFTGRSVGYLVGCILGGVLFDKLNQPCLLSFSLLLTAVGTAAAPWCTQFLQLVVVFAFQGVSMGFLDTGGNVMCVHTWGEDNGPWMQGLHFAFGIGAFVAPLIAEPFLSQNSSFTTNMSYFFNESRDLNGDTPIALPDMGNLNPVNKEVNKRSVGEIIPLNIVGDNVVDKDSLAEIETGISDKLLRSKRAVRWKKKRKPKKKPKKKAKPKPKPKQTTLPTRPTTVASTNFSAGSPIALVNTSSNATEIATASQNASQSSELDIAKEISDGFSGSNDTDLNLTTSVTHNPLEEAFDAGVAEVLTNALLNFIRNMGRSNPVLVIPGAAKNKDMEEDAKNSLANKNIKRPRPKGRDHQMPNRFIPQDNNNENEPENVNPTTTPAVNTTTTISDNNAINQNNDTASLNVNLTVASATLFHPNLINRTSLVTDEVPSTIPVTFSEEEILEQLEEKQEEDGNDPDITTKRERPFHRPRPVRLPFGGIPQKFLVDDNRNNQNEQSKNNNAEDEIESSENEVKKTVDGSEGENEVNKAAPVLPQPNRRVVDRPRPSRDRFSLLPQKFLVDTKSSKSVKKKTLVKTGKEGGLGGLGRNSNNYNGNKRIPREVDRYVKRNKRDTVAQSDTSSNVVENNTDGSISNNTLIPINSTTTTAAPKKVNNNRPMVVKNTQNKDAAGKGLKVLQKETKVEVPTIKPPTTTTKPLPVEDLGNGTEAEINGSSSIDVDQSLKHLNISSTPVPSTTIKSTTVSTTTTRTSTTTTVPPTTTTTVPPTTTTASTTKLTTKLTTRPTSVTPSIQSNTITEENITTGNDSDDTTEDNSDKSIGNTIKTKVQDVVDNVVGTFTYAIEEMHGLTMVQFAYLTIASYILFISFLFMILCCNSKCTVRSIKMPHSPHSRHYKYKESKGFKIQLIILLFIFFFLYVGMEITYGALLLSFSVEYLGWSKSQGTLITSVFYGSFAAARGLTIFLAKCLSPSVILILDLILTNLSLVALLISIDSNPAMMWYCNVILGMGLASIFPTGISWAECYIDLTGKATATFVIGSAIGEMLMPAFTGFMFEVKGPMYLMYIMMGAAIVSIVVFIIMQNMASNSGEKYSKLSKLSDTTLTELEHADLEMDSIPLTPDLSLEQSPMMEVASHTSGGYCEQNGTTGKSRKKVTFNFKDGNNRSTPKSSKGFSSVRNKVKGSILKIKGSVKND